MTEPAESPGEGAASGKGKLNSLSREDLIRFVKKQIEHVKASKSEIVELRKERDEFRDALTKSLSEIPLAFPLSDLTEKEKEELENRIVKMNEEIATLQSQLDDARYEVQALKQTRGVAEARSLELDDYEKKVHELTKELKNVRAEYTTTDNKIADLNEKLAIASESFRKSELEKDDLRLTITNLQAQAIENERELYERGEALRETRARLDSLLEERTREGLELGTRLNERELHAGELERTVETLRDVVATATARAEEAEEQRRTILKDFQEYKARAQYVLEQRNREAATENTSIEASEQEQIIENLKEESMRLNKVIESLQHSLALSEASSRDSSHSLRERELELAELRRSCDDMKHRLQTRTEELKEARAALDSLSAHYKIASEKVQHTQLLLEKANQQSEKVIAARSTDRETTAKQIRRLEEEIDELRRARDDALQALEQRKKAEVILPQASHASTTPQRTAVVLPQLSRWTEPPASDSRADSRLSTELEDRTLEDVLFGQEPTDTVCSDVKPKVDDTLLKQLAHTRELLNESEAANARLLDQTEFLKEEIRRMERDKERKEHLANTEYLKNVIVKFLTPERVAGERAQLLPVLTTMLRLSKEELEILEKVADEDKVLEDKASAGNWGNYLHRWTGFS